MTKRFISLTVAITVLFIALISRTGYIMLSGAYAVSDSYNSYTLIIDKLQPNIYYKNGSKLTNNKSSYVAVIRPNRECLFELNTIYNSNDKADIIDQLSKGYPVVVSIDSKYRYKFKYIKVYKDYYSSANICSQLINKSSSGLLSHTDDIIGTMKVNFGVDANGRLLTGDGGTLINDNYDSKRGFTLNLDESIQKITYDACSEMKSGCAVVMNVKNGSLLACVTKPDNCFTNKAFGQYAVGSVFKIIVSACALENNVDISYNCTGSITVGDSVYSCQGGHIHSFQNMKNALANSCNCYFVNLALTLGYEKLSKTAKDFGFDSTTKLYNDWIIKNSVFPSTDTLKSKGQLALLGFGQGSFTASPLQICSSFCTIANSGYKNDVKLIHSVVDDKGSATPVGYNSEVSVIKSENAKKMLNYMRYVVTNGTGKNADDSSSKSAGKTATAQTGQYVAGKEIYNTWFAGVYPYDTPKYAIVIMTEQGSSGAEDCCPIFRTIVEKLK